MLPVPSNTNSATTSSSATSPQSSIHTDVNLTLPLPSIFQNTTNMNPPILFSPSASLTPSFMLPSSQSSLMAHNSNIFQDASQPYGMDMPTMVEQFNMHNHGGHSAHGYSPAIQYPYLYLQQSAAHQQQVQQHPHAHLQANIQQQISPATATATTPTKSTKRKHSAEKKETTAPNTIPKCTRCSEAASWRHDKRRWWCKECKKAFTPGISKQQNVSPSTPQAQIPMAQHQQWDQTQPNSSQNTPPSIPQNPNQTTAASCTCPSCGGSAGWKHDKKRWYCKDCKKAFTPPHDGAPTSPTSPKPKKTKQKKPAAVASPSAPPPTSTVNNQILQNPAHIQPQQLPPFSNPMFLPPLGPNKDMTFNQMRPSPTLNNPSIPSPSSIMNMPSQVSMNSSLLVNGNMINPSLSPTGAKKMAKKKEKDNGNDGLQVLVNVDNGLPDLSSRSMGDINGVSDYSKMTQKYPVQDLRYIAS